MLLETGAYTHTERGGLEWRRRRRRRREIEEVGVGVRARGDMGTHAAAAATTADTQAGKTTVAAAAFVAGDDIEWHKRRRLRGVLLVGCTTTALAGN